VKTAETAGISALKWLKTRLFCLIWSENTMTPTKKQIKHYKRLRNYLHLALGEMKQDTFSKWDRAISVLKFTEARCSILIEGIESGDINVEEER